MKYSVVLFGLSVVVLVVVIFQGLRQEMEYRDVQFRTLTDWALSKAEEKSIDLLKPQVKQLQDNLDSIKGRIEELKKRKVAAQKTEKEHTKTLQTCNEDKESKVKNKKAATDSIATLKADHAVEKAKAEEEVQGLKQHILDRDKAICIFADPSIAEARTLCGINAPQ
ncbi:uncharacterized protein si:dkey-87o1.2 [Entelurus aequoreus]|uniref:uncharacterized protein si:dkey-87o1.2 n=1 Tax=Entelurus aequoreus TaxID=161455 RepID=UPI002B1DCCA6|nr:uncharacterized protein si:dkey-87o1.2 [Entelurus aequoreus]